MPSTSLPADSRDPAEVSARIARLEKLAWWLDSGFRVPGTALRFGWDSIIGLVPGIGDLLTALPGLWILTEARALGARKRVLARMALNTGADVVLGSVPLIGDLADVAIKANRRNVALLRAEMTRGQSAGPARPVSGTSDISQAS